VAVLGLTLHSVLFPRTQPHVRPTPGLQPTSLQSAPVYLLPNPSGRNAHYSLDALVLAFEPLREFLPHA
jgi:TDG/mug DNA glycosylase family protein